MSFSSSKFFLLAIILGISTFSCGVKKDISKKKETEEKPRLVKAVEDTNPQAPPAPVPEPWDPNKQEVFVVVESMPRFPGCEDISGTKQERKRCSEEMLVDYVYKNLEYPEQAKTNGVQGTCILQFVVTKSGSLKNIKVLRDIGAGCGAAAIKVIEGMNEKGIKWIPGTQRGRPVDVRFNFPVRFKLPN